MQTALGTGVAQVWFPFLEQRAHQRPEPDGEAESSLLGGGGEGEAHLESRRDTDGRGEGEGEKKCNSPKRLGSWASVSETL